MMMPPRPSMPLPGHPVPAAFNREAATLPTDGAGANAFQSERFGQQTGQRAMENGKTQFPGQIVANERAMDAQMSDADTQAKKANDFATYAHASLLDRMNTQGMLKGGHLEMNQLLQSGMTPEQLMSRVMGPV